MENVLLIGNGFDRSHGYPTSYLEFAEYVETFFSLYNNPIIRQLNGLNNIAKPKYDYMDWFIFSFQKYSAEFAELLSDNMWMWSFDEKDFERRKLTIENYLTRKQSKPTIEYKQI